MVLNLDKLKSLVKKEETNKEEKSKPVEVKATVKEIEQVAKEETAQQNNISVEELNEQLSNVEETIPATPDLAQDIIDSAVNSSEVVTDETETTTTNRLTVSGWKGMPHFSVPKWVITQLVEKEKLTVNENNEVDPKELRELLEKSYTETYSLVKPEPKLRRVVADEINKTEIAVNAILNNGNINDEQKASLIQSLTGATQ